MEKRKTPCPEGLPKEKANFDIAIVSEFDNEAQGIFWETGRSSQLTRFIASGQLTNCLDSLESRGFSGESALFLLAYLQRGGGAV
jgi:hypothetical protein